MQTIKLKRKLRKSRKHNRTIKRHTMKRGGMKRTLEKAKEEAPVGRRSARLTNNPSLVVNTVVIENGEPASDTYGKNIFTPEQIRKFVKNAITDGYQIVSLPTTPDSHSIIVIVGESEIKIIDWNNSDDKNTTNDGYDWGKEFLELNMKRRTKILKKFKSSIGLTEEEENYIKWHQYAILIDEIKSKYPRHKLIFEGVDQSEEIYKKAEGKRISCGMGGCSEYVHQWLDQKGRSEGFSPLHNKKTY